MQFNVGRRIHKVVVHLEEGRQTPQHGDHEDSEHGWHGSEGEAAPVQKKKAKEGRSCASMFGIAAVSCGLSAHAALRTGGGLQKK